MVSMAFRNAARCCGLHWEPLPKPEEEDMLSVNEDVSV